MFSLSRYLCYVGGASVGGAARSRDYHNTPKVSDVFHAAHQRANGLYDHVLIDVPSLIYTVAFLTRDLIGPERDSETVKNAQRQLQSMILRRLQPRKSLALLFDGSEPLWLMESTRLFPGRRYDAKFFRSCASPMPYLLEEKLRAAVMEMRAGPAEVLLSGPSTPGLSEGKASAYLLDLATRIAHPPQHPPNVVADITASDSICVVGSPELAWTCLGATPFHNLTTVTLQQGELLSCSLQETMEWLRLGHLLPPHKKNTASAAENVAALSNAKADDTASIPQQQQRRLAAVRTDLVFLHLLTNGHATTGLPQVLATPFQDVVDAYLSLEDAFHRSNSNSTGSEGASPDGAESGNRPTRDTPRFRSYLFDEEPLTEAHLDRPSLRLRVAALQKLLVRVYRDAVGESQGVPVGSKPIPHASTLLTLTLQTHGMLCAGGVPSPDWTPTPDTGATSSSSSSSTSASPLSGTVLLDKYPKLSVEQLIQHTHFLTTSSMPKDTSAPSHFFPSRSRRFGLTGAEALLMTATQPEQVHQLLPLYTRGHALPGDVVADIVRTRNVHEALRKTQHALRPAVAQADKELRALTSTPTASSSSSSSSSGSSSGAGGPHPALTNLPSHLFVRTPGSAGPPHGWGYYGVHLGVKAETMNVRYCLNSTDTAMMRAVDSSNKGNSSST